MESRDVWCSLPKDGEKVSESTDTSANPMRCMGMVHTLAPLVFLLNALLLESAEVAQDVTTVTTVTTAQGLKAALDGGSPHVHITQHLDLSNLPAAPKPVGQVNPTLFWLQESLQTVTV
jgi:hypothetical protein